jgi:hypothetical protein
MPMVRITPPGSPEPLVMEVVTDPVELAKAQAQRERFDRNVTWLKARADEVYSQNRGKYICVCGQELFVAETVQEAVAKAKAAHPDDDGFLFQYILPQKMVWTYATIAKTAENPFVYASPASLRGGDSAGGGGEGGLPER